MKRKCNVIIATVLLLFSLFFSLPACSQSGETKVVLVENNDTMVVMKIQSTDGNATAFDALKNLHDEGKITFTYTVSEYGAMIESIGDKQNVSSPTEGYSWMLYTSDTEQSSTEFGSITYQGQTLGQAAVGASFLKVKEGEYYVWSYDYWNISNWG